MQTILRNVLFSLLLIYGQKAAAVTYTFTGSGNWNVTGNWMGGTIPPATVLSGDIIIINGSGSATLNVTTTLNAGATLTINAFKTLEVGAGSTLTNSGIINNNGVLTTRNASIIVVFGVLNNNNGAVYNDVGNMFVRGFAGSFINHGGAVVNILSGSIAMLDAGITDNFGEINLTTSSNLSTSSGQINNKNGGNIINSGGDIRINIGLLKNESGATIQNKLGGTVELTAAFDNYGTFDNIGSVISSGINTIYNYAGGVINNNGGTWALAANGTSYNYGVINNNSGSWVLSGATQTLFNYQTINNFGTIEVGSSIQNAGIIENNPGAIFKVAALAEMAQGPLATFTNQTGAQFFHNGYLSNFGLLTNKTGASFTFSDLALSITYNGFSGIINNSGTWEIGPSGLLSALAGSTITNDNNFTNKGKFYNFSSFTNNGSYFNIGTYEGSGTYTGTVFTNPSGGKVIPGSSPGCHNFSGQYINNAGAILQMEINGAVPCTEYDQLFVDNNATLNGILNVKFGFVPTAGQQFLLIDAGSYTGSFSSIAVTPAHAVSYANGILTVNSVLPVTLTSFSARLQQNDVLLQWKTTDAVNFSHFELERSTDGILFNMAAKKSAMVGNTSITYDHADKDALHLFRSYKYIYYRLRMVDIDGKFTYSSIVKVKTKNDSVEWITGTYPNPFTNTISIGINHGGADRVVIKLMDVKGSVIRLKQVTPFPGFSTIVIDGLDHLNKGVYLLQITSAGNTVSRKIIKQ